MKAWLVEEANGPFVEKDVVRPVSHSGQVLVRVLASGVNPLDLKIRAGAASHARHPLPAILGLDMAGIVESAEGGPFHPGDAVYGMVGGVGGHQGTLAEYVVADASLLAHKPKSLTMREAAALPLASITAWEGLVDRAKVASGDTVLIHAAAGGVGNIAMQLAKAFGARVCATVSPAKRVSVQESAVELIDYTHESMAEYVARLTDGVGFDIVYDTQGGAVLDASFSAVRQYSGRVVSCLGWGTHALAPLSFRSASYSGVFTLHPLLSGEGRQHHGSILSQVAELADQGKIRPLMHNRRFQATDLEAAYSAVAQGAVGKVVIDME